MISWSRMKSKRRFRSCRKAAQESPEDYRDLLVRMAGYSDYFNDMNADLQQEVIERTENESF